MEDRIKEFVKCKKVVEGAQQEINLLVSAVKETEAYKRFNAIIEEYRPTLQELENEIRAGAVNEYLRTGDKKPWLGIGIQERTKIEYDIALVTDWCKINLPSALTVDKKKFEEVIKKFSPEDIPSYVTIEKVPNATIASDLSAYEE